MLMKLNSIIAHLGKSENQRIQRIQEFNNGRVTHPLFPYFILYKAKIQENNKSFNQKKVLDYDSYVYC